MASSSSHKSFKYDVFLSFCGEDVRKTFVDHLNHALQQKSIRTYKDDEKINQGNWISDELIGSIEDSKLYIIVFSTNYASSSWCLDELVKIMECHKCKEHTAYPIFYDVEPTEVRNQSGAVGKAFSKLENKEAAEKWRNALIEAANLAGWELKNTADGHENKFIQKVVELISLVLRSINFTIDETLVGIETRINGILSSLETGSNDVRVIGIKGMGGSGKTTLARAIFDQISYQFEGRSFVERVREDSKASPSGLKSLQNQILSDVFNDKGMTVSSVHEGIRMMQKRMPSKKVLLVLDDVDHRKQLKVLAGEMTWFKPGSIIIITTRDRQVLEFYAAKSIHDVQLLSDEEATCLFNRHAFGKVNPNPRFIELSLQVVGYAAGLPLAIEVLGSFLCGKDEDEWMDAVSRFKTNPSPEILEILEISYSDLENDYKEMFLNIACFLKGQSKADAIKVLESCECHAKIGLNVLEQKSLITVNHSGYLGMHDHIEEMGKNIVRRSHPDNPNKHSRLWIDEEIEDILSKNLGTEATRYIQSYTLKLSPEVVMKGLSKMKELRFLNMNMSFIDKSKSDCSRPNSKFYKFPNALRYLCWNRYPFRSLPETFQADNLVALKMVRSNIVQLWEGGERKVRNINKLRFLDIRYSMLRTLNLQVTPSIETLDLRGCRELVELRFPIRSPNLRSLKLNNSKIRTLGIGLTPNLEELEIQNCHDMEELHKLVGCLKLITIELSRCSQLRTLDLGSAPNIELLHLKKCSNLVELQMPIRSPNIRSLKLNLSKIRTLDIGLSPNLNFLMIRDCHDMEELHMLARCLKLISIEVISCSQLRTLDLGPAPNIEMLDLEHCWNLVELHMPIRFTNLRSLKLSYIKIRTLDIGLTPNLKDLEIQNCDYMEELHMLDGCLKLITIKLISCLQLRTLELRSAPNLELLHLEKNSNLVELHMPIRSPNLRSLKLRNSKIRTLDIGSTPNLKNLCIDDCDGMEELHMAHECLKKLVRLNLGNCLRFRSFQFFIESYGSFTEDESLEVGHLAKLHVIVESLDGGPLQPDKFHLECFYQEDRPLFTRNLEKLISLGFRGCTNIDTLARSICGLQRLRTLKLEGGIPEVPKDLDQLECLEELEFSCTDIKYLPDNICMLKHLQSLDLNGCLLLERLPEVLGQLECLKKLALGSAKIVDLPDGICMLKHLESLELKDCSLLEKLPMDLGRLECIENLDLSYCKLLRDIPDSICKMKCLKHLYLRDCIALEKLPKELGRLESLKYLDLRGTCTSHLPQSIFSLKDLRITEEIGDVYPSGPYCYIVVSTYDFKRLGRPGKKKPKLITFLDVIFCYNFEPLSSSSS